MGLILIRSEAVHQLQIWEGWAVGAGHETVVTTSLAAAHAYLFRAERRGRMPDVLVTTMPPTEGARAILRWDWLDALRTSAGTARLLLLARHESLFHSPRPGSVLLADPDVTEPEFRACLERLLGWPTTARRPIGEAPSPSG